MREINYPSKIKKKSRNNVVSREINYPNKIRKKSNLVTSTSRRGMNLENLVNEANSMYLFDDIALIYKKPVPITISKISENNGYKYISKAYFSSKSTTDYNGVYKGHYIDFDTKETNNVKYFPLSNLHEHQYDHLQKSKRHGGIAFLIIAFTKFDEIYIVFIEDFVSYVEESNSQNVPYEYIKANGHLVEYNYLEHLDYLKIVDNYIKKLDK